MFGLGVQAGVFEVQHVPWFVGECTKVFFALNFNNGSLLEVE